MCQNLTVDLAKISINSDSIGTVYPINIRQIEGKPLRSMILKPYDMNSALVKVDADANKFSLDFDIGSLEEGDKVVVKLTDVFCGSQRATPQEIHIKEGSRWIQQQ
jgi:hypothetical protein